MFTVTTLEILEDQQVDGATPGHRQPAVRVHNSVFDCLCKHQVSVFSRCSSEFLLCDATAEAALKIIQILGEIGQPESNEAKKLRWLAVFTFCGLMVENVNGLKGRNVTALNSRFIFRHSF